MTYQVLKMVLAWAVEGANKPGNGDAYQKALAELAVAIKRVMQFN
jgi:hypothetical protein